MKAGRLVQGIGFGLLVVTMLWAAFSVFARARAEADPDLVHIRFAHNMLTREARGAFAAVIDAFVADQDAKGRRVRVTPLEVPERAYPAWLRTQFVGGTAPEIAMTDRLNAPEGEFLARYFEPMGRVITQPNPYNTGTPLEGLRWRDTFLDGMEVSGFSFPLAEHYGVALAASTNRIFINTRLRNAILESPEGRAIAAEMGPKRRPETFDQFIALCEAVERYRTPEGGRVIPLAGSREIARSLMDDLMQGETQMLNFTGTPLRDLRTISAHMLVQFASGNLWWDHPAFRSGLELQRSVGRFFTPGFAQLQRDDAAFQFTQGVALMIVANTRDAATYRSLAGGTLDMDFFMLPQPDADHPKFGRWRLGRLNEMSNPLYGTLCLVNIHPPRRKQVALEFLQFITSWEGNRIFAEAADWLPSVVEVPVPEAIREFAPVPGGFGRGPQLSFSYDDLRRPVETQWHVLFASNSGVDAYFDSVVPAMRTALLPQLRRVIRANVNATRRQDSLIAAALWQLDHSEAEHAEDAARRYGMLVDSAMWNNADRLYYEMALRAGERRGL